MMPSNIISAAIPVCCASLTGLIGYYVFHELKESLLFAAAGIVAGILCQLMVRTWMRKDAWTIIGAAVGVLWAALLAVMTLPVMLGAIPKSEISVTVATLATVLLCLIGLQLGAAKASEIKSELRGEPAKEPALSGILDTSVIIDGRIADICETGFLAGVLVIPQFVLQELQSIADSSESTKRTRGRRGLDILNKIKKQSYINIIINETDYPSIKEVDQKLIRMAKESNYALITNDFNLNKVAEVHSIQVLNINSLANALKPIVLPGESMRVQVLKEGKEPGQGVAYLDDGTMVVIENGRRFMGRTLDVIVTSVLQTTAGRMIFANVKGSP